MTYWHLDLIVGIDPDHLLYKKNGRRIRSKGVRAPTTPSCHCWVLKPFFLEETGVLLICVTYQNMLLSSWVLGLKL